MNLMRLLRRSPTSMPSATMPCSLPDGCVKITQSIPASSSQTRAGMEVRSKDFTLSVFSENYRRTSSTRSKSLESCSQRKTLPF